MTVVTPVASAGSKLPAVFVAPKNGFRTFAGDQAFAGPRLTGVEAFDDLAEGTAAFERFSRKLEKAGFEIKRVSFGANDDTIAQFNKGVFEYDPGRFRVLNLLHENRHLTQINGAKRAGSNPFGLNSKARAALETDAYQFELSLARKYEFSDEFVTRTRQLIDGDNGYYWKWQARYRESERFSDTIDAILGYRPGRY